jgi:hypothetical protein
VKKENTTSPRFYLMISSRGNEGFPRNMARECIPLTYGESEMGQFLAKEAMGTARMRWANQAAETTRADDIDSDEA